MNVGYHSGPSSDDAARMAIVEEGCGLFRAAGIDSQAMPNLRQARWQKLVWNIPYNGLSVLLGASTTPLMADADSRTLIQALMAEVVQGAKACGHDVPPGYADYLFMMTEKMPDYWPSMYHDFYTSGRWSWRRSTLGHWQRRKRRAVSCRASKRCIAIYVLSTGATFKPVALGEGNGQKHR